MPPPRALRRPAAKACLRPRSRVRPRLRPRRVTMELVDSKVNEGGCNNVFIDMASHNLITLDTIRVHNAVSLWSNAPGRQWAVYDVVFEPFSEEQRSATGVSGIMISALPVRLMCEQEYRRLCAQTGFRGWAQLKIINFKTPRLWSCLFFLSGMIAPRLWRRQTLVRRLTLSCN
jgi:hypothetical protein